MDEHLQEALNTVMKELEDLTDSDSSDDSSEQLKMGEYLQRFDLLQQSLSEDTDPPDGLGCPHYMRGCEIWAECCQKFYVCRLCHDEANDYHTVKTKEHTLDRTKVEKIRCLHCKHEQKPALICDGCGIKMANYFCAKCNLFDYINRNQYHCDKCKMCRVALRPDTNMCHCDTCDLCHSMDGSYPCRKGVKESTCPICMEDLFASTGYSMNMKCGHTIHMECLNTHLKTSYKCPTCSKSIIDTTQYFTQLESVISAQPVPEEYQRKANIMCNDCLKTTEVDFHFIAMKCPECNSYNTSET